MASPSEGSVIGFNVNMMLDFKADPESPDMIKKWRYMKELHDRFFEEPYPLQLFRGVKDPFIILSAGPWTDLQEHIEDFARSPEMDDFLDAFDQDIKILGAFHLQKKWAEMPAGANHLSLMRYFIKVDKVSEFQQAIDSFLPGFVAHRKDKVQQLSGWRMLGGWNDSLPSDDAMQLGGVDRPGFNFVLPVDAEQEKNMEMADDGSDEDTREFIVIFSWSSREAMDEFAAEMQVPFKERHASWHGQDKVVAASRVACVRNFRRISLEEAS